ncbi:MAG: 7-carboxy-7-deazaguanine synthase QueE [Bacteroidales bacterium]|jgi:organic radical activating enzyme|nr:7-carboxy-7-deazaguanine synthase QueE [Bacteroidales bacterium]
MYPVVETFYSLQGEGAYSGTAAFFIRLAGCPVKCVYCDEARSWNMGEYPLKSSEELAAAAIAATAAKNTEVKTAIAIVTGGEPVIHNLAPLTAALQKCNIRTHLETSGTNPLTGEWDYIAFSPKRTMPPVDEYYKKSNEIKIVIETEDDFDFAEQQRILAGQYCTKLYLQPEWNNRVAVTSVIIDYIKRNPQWKLSLQIHKYLDIR